MKDRWIEDLRKISTDGTRRPPEGLLDDIKKTMSDRGVMPSGGNAHVRRINFAPFAIAASVAAVVACVLFIRRPSQVQQMTATDFSVIERDGESELYASLEKLPEAKPVPELRRKSHSQEIVSAGEQTRITETLTEEDPTGGNLPDDVPDEKTEDTGVEKGNNYQQPDPDYDAFRETGLSEKKKSSGGVSVGGGFTGLFSGLFSDWENEYDDIAAVSGIRDLLDANGAPVQEPESSDADHRRPVRFGLSFKYMINDRWGLVSGVSLSYLRSEFDNGYSNNVGSVNTVRKLHYIGIPLGVSWNYFSSGKTDFYLTAGGMAETLLYGKDVVKRSQNGMPYSSVSTRVHDGSVVFSTNASLGFEYRLAPHFSVYAEPGLTYYFDCGNVTSFYTDNRFNFDLRLGVRFSLGK